MMALSEKPDRYPAISPDGQWLAFSRLDHGAWNLWLTNLRSNLSRRISRVDCDQITPSWQDSETLLYATDCGRGLMLTAIARTNIAEFLRP
jgi:Tol biopolymer transport system component